MILLKDKFAKLFKKENPHKCHPQPNEELSSSASSLHAFHSHVFKLITQLALELKHESEILSLSWFQRCFGLLLIINKAFDKLVVDIDYPMSQWKIDSIEGYNRYTINLLWFEFDLILNLGHARLSLAHGLNLILKEKEKSFSLARKYLKTIQPTKCFSTKFGKSFHKHDDKAKIFSGKEMIVHEGIKEMKSIGFWVCGVLLSCLYGDNKPYMELRKISGGFDGSLIAILDSKISEKLVKKKLSFREIKEINNCVANIVAADEVRFDAAKELQRKVCELEKLIDDISKEVDHLFESNDISTQILTHTHITIHLYTNQ